MKAIIDIVNKRGGIVSLKDITDNTERMRIQRAADRGSLIKIRQGLYATHDALLHWKLDLEQIVPDGVICLYNAWAHHKLCKYVPQETCIAIYTKRSVRVPEELPIQLYYWKKEYLDFGIEEHIQFGHRIRITDLEKSVCDAIKYRNKIGMELFSEILMSYMKRNDKDLNKLQSYAENIRVAKILKKHMDMSSH